MNKVTNKRQKYKEHYKIVCVLECNGKTLFVVEIGMGIHVLDEQELKRVYGCLHPERWKEKKENVA